MDEANSSLIIAASLVFILAIITGAIIAVSSLRLSMLEKLSDEGGEKRAKRLLKVLEQNRDRIYSGLSAARLLLALIIGALLAWYGARSLPYSGSIVYYEIIISIIAVLLFTESIPRFIVNFNPEKSAIILRPVIYIASAISVPASNFFRWLLAPITGRLNPDGRINSRITEDEIMRIVEEGHELGILEEEEKKMIHSIFEFTDTIAREVMIPRVDIVALDSKATVSDAIKLMASSGFSRLPIYNESLDDIPGIVYTKDFLSAIREGNLDTPAINYARKPPFFIPDTKPVGELLREMQKKSISIAIVVDEYGGTDGLVTIEDLLEEIVGDITDEYDREEPSFIMQPDGSWIVDGGTIIEDVNSHLDINVPADEHETIGGFVSGYLGRIPAKGDTLKLDDLEIDIKVGDIKGQRIQNVIIKKHDNEEESEEKR